MKAKKTATLLAFMLAITLPVLGLASEDFGAAAVNEGETYTIEQMLTYAIQDEYLAQAEYKEIIAAFGVDRPFSNIMKAEAIHVERLTPLFAAYNTPIPEDTGSEHVVLRATLQDIYDPCITAEINNIAMYEAFLKQQELPEDVRSVFTALKRASENHLQAFQRNADKPGDGQASRSGNRWSDDAADSAYGNRNQSGDTVNEGTQNRNGRGRRGN